ncbi:hypothetical protein QUA54_33255 [Microcoleus sp. MOSTC5]|uniref:hypothetical protein n=1 Tax=Microcoleus sp. MOSTC5 TaxID=3055378 RepID=UPI002FD2F43E
MSVDHVPNNVTMPCENLCIKGKVVCIFRGRRSIRIGDSVEFDVAVEGEPYILRTSGILWLNYSNLLQANYMEVFLNGKPPNCSIALYQYELIEAPTKNPTLSSPQPKWWDKPLEVWHYFIRRVSYWIQWGIWLP